METYYSRNREKIKFEARSYRRRMKMDVLRHYGGNKVSCVVCGENRLPCLSLDHINGDGHAQSLVVGRGNKLYLWIKNNNYPQGYQTLCMNCQWIKRHENQEYKNQYKTKPQKEAAYL